MGKQTPDERDLLSFNRPFIVGKELFNIARAVCDGHLSGDGPFTKYCHAWLERELGAKRAFLTHSCTGALEMAALLCDIGPGDEVVMPSFTFVSTANAFVLRGGVPVFVDIDPETLNIDASKIRAALTPRTRAIVPVHYAGLPCDLREILAIARDAGVRVVEDAAQALMSKYDGRYLGTIGDLGCLSFHETKNLISGEGGALLVNDPALIERAEILREKGTNRSRFFRGQVDKYTWVDVGSSFLPSELIGAFLAAQLDEAEKVVCNRRASCEQYRARFAALAEAGLVRLPRTTPQAANGHMFYLVMRSLDERTRLIEYLRERLVQAVFHYVPLHSSPAGLQYGRTPQPLPVTDEIADRLVRLPLYYDLAPADLDRVVAGVYGFFGREEPVEPR